MKNGHYYAFNQTSTGDYEDENDDHSLMVTKNEYK